MNTLEYIFNKYSIKGTPDKVEIPNMDRRDLARLFNDMGYKLGAEIGTERGVYAKEFLSRAPDITLHCIDPWLAYRGYREHVTQSKLDGFFTETTDRLKDFKAVIIRKTSDEAVKDYKDESLDFVYIDGNHDFQYAVNDICNWSKKVRKGGIVAGHDYIKRVNPEYLMGVVQAVDAYVDFKAIKPLFIVGSKEVVEGEKRDKQRSWFFVK